MIANSQLQITSVKMTASDRLLKKNQSNFLLSNFREFYKLWRDDQEANLTVKCCDGKLSINFESSFRSPETKPTLQTIEKGKVKRISPSRRRRNQARAEKFRSNKASKDEFKETPAPLKEGQEEMQGTVSGQESASEVPADRNQKAISEMDKLMRDLRNLESNPSLMHFESLMTSLGCSRSKSTPAGKGPPDPAKSQANAENPPLFTKTPVGKGPPDPTDDAENSLPESRVKRKAKRRQDKRIINATVNEKPEATVAVETSEMSGATRVQWTQDSVSSYKGRASAKSQKGKKR